MRMASAENMIGQLTNGSTGIIGSFSSRIDPPCTLLKALLNSNLNDLTLVVLAISNDTDPIGKMIKKGMLRKLITGFNNSNSHVKAASMNGSCDVQFVPYGTLVEKIRLGAAGIPAFFSPVGIGSIYSEGKELTTIDGQDCLLEHSIRADFSLIRSALVDEKGNVKYWHSARHMNHYAAMAAKKTLLQADSIVSILPAEDIDTASIFVSDFMVESPCDVNK